MNKKIAKKELISKANKIKIDPYLMLKQIQELRKEGFDEETLRHAFNQLMEETNDNRKKQRRMLKTKDSSPMPSQKELNELYEKRLQEGQYNSFIDPQLNNVRQGLTLIDLLQLIEERNKKPTLKMRIYRFIYLVLKGPVNFLINILKEKK